MSEVWNEGYFTDVGYTYGYYRDISPTFHRFCLLLRGFAAPEPTADSVHCELGFGQGVSINHHAAATPGLFVGTDFNPAHAAHANTLADASGSGARLYDDSFEQLLGRNDLPLFDSISLHGIWTWVSRDNHKIITEFARRHLKPGGVFYISYNCFPGWSPNYPLRQLFALHDRYGTTPHGAVERVEAALKFSENLLAAQPNYAKLVPNLGNKLKSIMEQNRHYLAHEYFNREWNCMYFTDVVDALAPAKLDYACTAVPLDAVDAVNLSAEGVAFLNTIEHPILREQVRDYFVNQQFRKDLYVRGARRITGIEQQQRLLDMRFALVKPVDEVPMKVNAAAGEATLQEALYRPLLDQLAERSFAPKSLRELMAALPNQPYLQLLQELTVLIGMAVVAPCQSEGAAKQAHKRCAALNAYLMERAVSSADIDTLASPVLGGGFPMGRVNQLFARARLQGRKTPQDWAHQTWQILESQGQRLLKDGKAVESAEANLAELNRQAVEFAEKRLPLLKALQVV